jgi:hypothetical protein
MNACFKLSFWAKGTVTTLSFLVRVTSFYNGFSFLTGKVPLCTRAYRLRLLATKARDQ